MKMQPIFFARRFVALGIAIALVVLLGGVLVWRTATSGQGAAGAGPGPGASGDVGELTDPAQVHEQWIVALLRVPSRQIAPERRPLFGLGAGSATVTRFGVGDGGTRVAVGGRANVSVLAGSAEASAGSTGSTSLRTQPS
jgi:hypothetical protein